MTALDNKDTFFGLRMRKRRTRLAVIFSVFIILAYFDPLKREVDEEAEKSSLGITSTPKGELSAETKAQTMVKSDKSPLATSLRDTHDNSQSSDAIISSQFIFPVGGKRASLPPRTSLSEAMAGSGQLTPFGPL